MFDGQDAVELLMRGCDLNTLLLTPTDDITAYNQACQQHDKSHYAIPPIVEPAEPPDADTRRRLATWLIPDAYRSLDLREYLLVRCQRPDEIARVERELTLFDKHGLIPVLRVMIYLVDHFRTHQVVWGVGRGSSVASYCLFLIGVHKIDSLAYGLPIEEFLRHK